MNDELLIRFIDGNTTPDETELVINELSQDDDAAKEWMQMVNGARLAGTEPLQKFVPTDVIYRTLKAKPAVSQRGKVRHWSWIISGIAAIAASIAIIVTVMQRPDNTEIPENVIADARDTTDSKSVSDTSVATTHLNIDERSHERIADSQITSQREEQNTGQDKASMEVKEDEILGKKIVKENRTASEFKKVEPVFEMVKPAKTPYRVKVKNIEKDFTFEWMTNAVEVNISITDNQGKTIIHEDKVSGNNYSVAAINLVNRGELKWKIEVTFNDGTIREKSGSIELVHIK